MQERYLGDIHDFYKFLFLKFTSSNINCKIGLNWYLNDPNKINEHQSNPNDGEKRDFNKKNLSVIDRTLYDEMKKFENFKKRNLLKFTSTSYLRKFINFYNVELQRSERKKWFCNSLSFFKNNDYLFLDPDNGLITKKINNGLKKSVKYVLPNEIKKLILHDISVTFCQFQSYNKNFSIMLNEKNNFLYEKTGLKFNCPIIRNRTSPNTFFITIATSKSRIKLVNNIKAFKKKFNIIELVEI